ncbi:MAG: hypothetical protein L6R39_007088, partial [Caloplaca ligustica]
MVDTIWAFAKTLDDILDKKRQGKAVVVYPRLSLIPDSSPEESANWDSIYSLIRDLFDANTVVVNCAGNEATSQTSRVDRMPAVWS